MAKFDYRRGWIRIGTVSIFAIGGPAIFGSLGLSSLIYYIASLAICRFFTAVIVSEATKHSPSIGLSLFRASPLMIVASATTPWFSVNIIEEAIFLMPILNGVYLGAFWVLLFDVNQHLGRDTADYQFTEVISSLLGAILGVSLTIIVGTEVAVAVGGGFVLLGTLVPLGVNYQEFGARLAEWSNEADYRPKKQVSNGLAIVAGVAVLNWCCLATLRIECLVGVPPILGVVSLGVALSGTEAIAYAGTRHLNIANHWFKLIACGFAMAGFCLMTQGGPIWTGAGYWFTSTSSRVYWRVFDRKVARAALRGVGGRPGSREIRRYAILLTCCPLLLSPTLLPYFGMLAVVVLMMTRNSISSKSEEKS